MSGQNVGEIRVQIDLEIRQYLENLRRIRGETEDFGERSRRNFGGIESALTSLGSTMALYKLVQGIKSVVDESNKLYNAMVGLSEVAKNLKLNVDATTKAAQDMAAKGFMSATEAAQAYKTALAMGLDVAQTTELINAMADAAAFNRQAHYSWGQSIVVAMEGIKNGNSVLTDSVGVTKNLSVMQEEYAKTIGTTAGKLSDAQKIQAAYNGFLNESALFAGNATVALDGYAGANSNFTTSVTQAKIAVGDGLKPVLEEVMKKLTPVITDFAKWASANKELVAGLVGATASVLSLITILATLTTVIKGLAVAFTLLQKSTGWIGLTLTAISLLVTALFSFKAASDAASESTWKFAQNVDELNKKMNESPLDRSVAELQELQEDTEILNGLLEERAVLQQRVNEISLAGERGQGTPQLLSEAMDLSDRIAEIDDQLKGLGFDNLDKATSKLGEMRQTIDESIPALIKMKETELADAAAKQKQVMEMERLSDRYKELSSQQSLDESQKQELVSVVNMLKKQYPDIHALMDEEGRIRIVNTGLLEDQISTQRRSVESVIESSKAMVSAWETQAQAQKISIEAQISNLEKLAEAMAAVSGSKSQFQSTNLGFYQEGMDKFVSASAQEDLKAAYDEQNKIQGTITELRQLRNNLETGNLDAFTYKPRDSSGGSSATSGKSTKSSGKSPEEIAADIRKKAYDADIATTNYLAEMYDWSADKQIEAYEKVRDKHKQHLAETIEDSRSLNLQLKRLNEDTVQSQFDASQTWISMEERRMQDSGKSEVEIAKTKIDAWTRLRNKYAKDSEFYKQADEQLYQARKALMQEEYSASSEWITQEERRMGESGKTEVEIEQMKVASWTRLRDKYVKGTDLYKKADEQLYQSKKRLISLQEKQQETLLKTQISGIEDARKAELAAIEERRKAFVSAQDDKIKAIDDLMSKQREADSDADYETQLAEKRARLALLQSAVGPEGIKEREDLAKEIERMQLEHSRDLRDRELESQKQALEDEKNVRNDAFDREKTDVESKYDALKEAFDTFAGDVQFIESAIADFRVRSNADTNTAILKELDSFVTEYNAKMASIQAISNGVNPDLTEYNANKDAWDTAKARGDSAEMARLKARNDELRKLYGISSDTGKLQAFKDGGVVGGIRGSAVPVVAHAGEMYINERQQAALFSLLNTPYTPAPRYDRATPTQVVNHFDMSVSDVTLEDGTDIETLYSERERVATRLYTTGVK